MIYRELLTKNSAITLYHDLTGRDSSLGLCPTILRVSRQVYSKSAWLLYENNAFLINLTTEIDQRCMRASSHPSGDRLYHQRPGLPTPREADLLRIRDDSTGEVKGLIYPHCLRRIHYLGLVTAGDAVRGLQPTSPFFSDTYELILDILKCLLADDDFDWTLGSLESSNAESEREKRAQEVRKSPFHEKSLVFVLLRRERITLPRSFDDYKEMDTLADRLSQMKRKRVLLTENMDECMRNVQQCRFTFICEEGL